MFSFVVDPLIHNVQKGSDTLEKSCSICCKISKVYMTILGHYALKGKQQSCPKVYFILLPLYFTGDSNTKSFLESKLDTVIFMSHLKHIYAWFEYLRITGLKFSFCASFFLVNFD